MPTSKADRLNKLFENDSLPSPPDPNNSHIADTEVVSKMQPVHQPWSVPKVAQTPRKLTKSPPRTGRGIDQVTSSDDDEYIRAFRKKPAIKSKTVAHVRPRAPPQGDHRSHERSKTTARAGMSVDAAAESEANDGRDDGVSNADRNGHPLLGRFCALSLVTKFCYKYMDDPGDRVSKRFFASGKIWNRPWDIYYVHALASFSKPILLVPENQVQKLLDEINSTFHISIKLPRDPFLLAFYQDGTPAPALLGISNSRETVGKMEQNIPSPPENFGECPASASPAEERSFERFKEKMERAAAAQKKKHAAVKKAKAKDRLVAHVNWCEALKRGQRYLGLRPLVCPGGLPAPDASLSWDEQQKYEREQKIKYGHILQSFNLSQAAPHPFDQDVVFVCVDVEAYERDHSLITEVGVSTLDTADIKSLAAGYGGFDWMERIRSRHFRVSEHQHLKNTSFCTGDPEKFLFGRSEFVSIKEVGGAVDSCFEPPYSSDFIHDGRFKAQDDIDIAIKKIDDQLEDMSLKPQDSVGGELPRSPWQMELVNAQGPTNVEQDLADQVAVSNILSYSKLPEVSQAAECSSRGSNLSRLSTAERYPAESQQSSAKKPKYRNVVLVGHDLDADLHYLSILKSKIFHNPPAVTYPQPLEPENPLRKQIIESLDTARLYQVFKRDSKITSLAKILVGVERTGWHLHNGGNDARYTLEAMVGILVRARLKEDEVDTIDSSVRGASGSGGDESQQPEDVLAKKINAKQRAVEKEERENAAMWRHAIGPYGSAGEILSDSYMLPTDGTTKDDQCEPRIKDTNHDGKLPKDRSKNASMACQAAPNADQSVAETQPESGAYA